MIALSSASGVSLIFVSTEDLTNTIENLLKMLESLNSLEDVKLKAHVYHVANPTIPIEQVKELVDWEQALFSYAKVKNLKRIKDEKAGNSDTDSWSI